MYQLEHPDMRRLRREMAALKAQLGEPVAPGAPATGTDVLREQEAKLAGLRKMYPDDHPDVQRLSRSIDALKSRGATDSNGAKEGAPRSSPPAETARKPDNPAYIALTTQLEGTKRELAQIVALRDELRTRQRTYDARLSQIPDIEREYRELTRDYDNTQTRYREVRAKQMQAEVAEELEKDRKAERFSLAEPTSLPEAPISPNRLRIVMMGFVGALGAGTGVALLLDAIDRSVKGPLELNRIASVPVLTAIPYIETRGERSRKRRRNLLVLAAWCLLSLAFVLAVHVYLRPLPELMLSVTRKLTSW